MFDTKDMEQILEIMAALRTPGTGCPWDLEQDFASIAPYTIEEAYEVADAISNGDMEDLKDELGDLLLQVVFHARMAEEAGDFDFGDVCRAISEKMVRRHPHVFADGRSSDAVAVKATWEAIKAEERAAKGKAADASLLDDVPVALPALSRAVKLQKRAARVGFDWDDPKLVIAKMREELDELEAEVDAGEAEAVRQELGDLLFAVANLARHLEVDPEGALRSTNDKFRRRFSHIEHRAREAGTPLGETSLEVMEAWWREAKHTEKP